MFNPYEELPSKVVIDRIEYPINMAYDKILNLYKVLSDKTLTDGEQIIQGFYILFGRIPLVEPEKLGEVWEKVFGSLFDSETASNVVYDLMGNPMPNAGQKDERFFDIYQDAPYIFASFMQDYNIDLVEQRGKLHWYKFKALLNGLSEDTKLRKVIEIRQMELPRGKGSEKRRQQVIELKKAYALKDVDE